MADSALVAEIKELIPLDAEGWNEQKIAQLLDQGQTKAKIMSRYWNHVAANSASFVNVMESGSSRDLSSIHKQALDMARYWDDKVKDEDKVDGSTVQPIVMHQMRRV